MADETEQVLAAEQDERRRIALFLHDGPVQSLAGVALMLDASLDLIERGDLEEAQNIIDRALIRTRSPTVERVRISARSMMFRASSRSPRSMRSSDASSISATPASDCTGPS